jgi:cold shock CspA family protein
MTTVPVTQSTFIGRVKWFNNKSGFGFITVMGESPISGDIFVHHSAIQVDSEQYKYLVQGEYVEFQMTKMTEGPHEFQAGNVCGIKKGMLMCETRREMRVNRSLHADDVQEQEQVRQPKSVAVPKVRGQGPREGGAEWSYVAKGGRPEQTPSNVKPRARKTKAGSV